MACGLPIVAYDTGAIKEVVGNAGIYIHEGDINGLLLPYANLLRIKSLHGNLVQWGRERVEKRV